MTAPTNATWAVSYRAPGIDPENPDDLFRLVFICEKGQEQAIRVRDMYATMGMGCEVLYATPEIDWQLFGEDDGTPVVYEPGTDNPLDPNAVVAEDDSGDEPTT
ncbi:MuF-like minor capsid protein [Mycobacterium phage Indlulamithi]|uniref:MuF-like minor capsid protein n=1 Tax=Mycobacterium phage Indlulamithi TaxID=2656582 RepID=A0A649VCI4_9CAUD|nr:MuF-like minor capsid protein [Mycobacterium phage Indlulamithi]QGJ90048.1 MuF-like minor capsid protein [Mycobacterium phage Indlulamithi]